MTILRTIIEDNTKVGLFVGGSSAIVEGSIVRGTKPAANGGIFGAGIGATRDVMAQEPSDLSIRGFVIESNRYAGVLVAGSTASMEGTVVRHTAAQASDQRFGDGFTIIRQNADASAVLKTSLIAVSERAGLSAFGATVTLDSMVLRCNKFDLEGEVYEGVPYTIMSGGGENKCGCPEATAECHVLTVNLEPPAPLPSVSSTE